MRATRLGKECTWIRSIYKMLWNLKHCQEDLKKWRIRLRGNPQWQIKNLSTQLEDLHIQDQTIDNQEQLNDLWAKEDVYWF